MYPYFLHWRLRMNSMIKITPVALTVCLTLHVHPAANQALAAQFARTSQTQTTHNAALPPNVVHTQEHASPTPHLATTPATGAAAQAAAAAASMLPADTVRAPALSMPTTEAAAPMATTTATGAPAVATQTAVAETRLAPAAVLSAAAHHTTRNSAQAAPQEIAQKIAKERHHIVSPWLTNIINSVYFKEEASCIASSKNGVVAVRHDNVPYSASRGLYWNPHSNVLFLNPDFSEQSRWACEDDITISMLQWSPDGHILAVGLSNGDIALLNADGTERCRWNSTETRFPFYSFAWSPDSRTLAIQINSRHVVVFDLDNSRKSIWNVVSFSPLAWAPDSRTLAVGLRDGSIMFLNRDGTERHRHPVLENSNFVDFCSLIYAPDGTNLAAASTDGRVFFLNPDGSRRTVWNSPYREHITLTYLPHTNTLAAATTVPEGILELLTLTSSGVQAERKWASERTAIVRIICAPHGNLLAARLSNGTILFLNVDGTQTSTWTPTDVARNPVLHIAWANDDTLLVQLKGGTVHVLRPSGSPFQPVGSPTTASETAGSGALHTPAAHAPSTPSQQADGMSPVGAGASGQPPALSDTLPDRILNLVLPLARRLSGSGHKDHTRS